MRRREGAAGIIGMDDPRSLFFVAVQRGGLQITEKHGGFGAPLYFFMKFPDIRYIFIF